MDDLEDHFWRKSTEIHNYYNMRALGYVNITFVTIAIISNIFMILVFTRKHMISPINTIFAHYIGNLTMTGFAYIPRTYHEFFRVQLCSIPEHHTYAWEMISYHAYLVSFVFRHIAIWMAMMLAVWRYIAVVHPLKERQYCHMNATNKLIYAGYFLITIISIPLYFTMGVGSAVKLLDENGCQTTNFTSGKNVTIYEFQIYTEDYIFLYSSSLYIYGIFLKLLPSFGLAFISIKLVGNLLKVRKRHTEMVAISNRKNTYDSKNKQQIKQKTDRTTKILVVILVLFVAGEVPHGTFAFLTAWYGPKFFWQYYYYAMEIFNTCVHIAEAFNFVVYYSMSYQFRSTFKSLFISNSNRKMITLQTFGSSLPGVDKPQDNSTRPSSNIPTVSSRCTDN